MSNSYYMNPLKELLRVVHYPHIEITSDDNLNEMLFKSGNARLEILRWLFCQIDDEAFFPDEKVKEELQDFAVNFGFCNIRESKSLVWGEPSCHAKRQFDFWRLVIETVRDVRMYKLRKNREGEKPKTGEFLQDLAKSGALEALINSTSSINICPALLDLDTLPKASNTPGISYQYQNDKLKLELQDKHEKLNSLWEEKREVHQPRSPVSANIVSQKIDEMMATLENSGKVFTSVLDTIPKPTELSASQLAARNTLDLAAESSKNVIKLVEDNKVLNNLASNTSSFIPTPVKHPEIINYIENNLN